MLYEFASLGWMAFAHGAICQQISGLGEEARDIHWSMCEVFTAPPPHLSPDGAPLAWYCFIRGGEVEFGIGDRKDVNLHITIDYQAVLPLGRYDTQGDASRAAELAEMAKALAVAGNMTVVGDRSRQDPRVASNHDLIARVTA